MSILSGCCCFLPFAVSEREVIAWRLMSGMRGAGIESEGWDERGCLWSERDNSKL